MSLLEERYRRALRMLPTSYRQQWEEDMVATFLERAYAADPHDPEGVELGSPSRSELASIAGLALRLRLGGTDAPPRSFVWGEAVRRVALVGILAHAITAVVGVGFQLWIAADLPLVTVPDDAAQFLFGPWHVLWIVTPLLWLPAYLSLVQGHWRMARGLSLFGLAMVLFAHAVDVVNFHGLFTAGRAYALLFEALPVLCLAAYHHTAPPVAGRPWLLALPIGVVPLFVMVLLSQPGPGRLFLLDEAAIWCAGVTVATLVWLALTVHGRRPDSPHWPLTLAILSAAVLGLRLTNMADLIRAATPATHATVLLINVLECLALLASTVGLTAYTLRALRRLPPASVSLGRSG